ncbi:MAG: glucoamylase family protein, partial [Acidobacteriota bacterium]
FQEDPAPVIAHRTSPTNIGLYLLSVVAARDFGWLGTQDAVGRLEATLASMGTLQRYRGHFYNWYDTQTLRPLEPKFISSVDSGNLAGHLVTLESACRQLRDSPRVSVNEVLAGIRDGLDITRESLLHLSGAQPDPAGTRASLEQALAALTATLAEPPGGAESSRLERVVVPVQHVVSWARTLSVERSGAGVLEVLACATAMETSVRSHLRDLEFHSTAHETLAPPLRRTTGAGATETGSGAVAATLVAEPVPQPASVMGPGSGTSAAAALLAQRLDAVAGRSRVLFDAMDFALLFDTDRQLLSIGYQVDDGKLDANCYDLLASEAHLGSFVAIAKGDVPTCHWFHLGRALTPVRSGAALTSWSGSMFEYLMPSLVMRAPPGSLLDETCQAIVRRQIDYGAERDLPWGISESAYNARDLERTYQYSSFGIPDLGLKRGLGDEAVVAPYATALAAMVSPHAAVRNYARLAADGARGHYGWYEALDYTPSRLPTGRRLAVVRAYMAHHQGMTLLALANTLLDGTMCARFHAAPLVQATELLLQERMPREVEGAHPRSDVGPRAPRVRELVPATSRRFPSPHQPAAYTQLLSNGRYAVMMTAAGSGYSRWGDLALTRWRADPTSDDSGSFIYLRDVEHGTVWSAGYQPTGTEPDRYEMTFLEERIECVRRDGTLTTRLNLTVSPEDDAEARRVTVSNGGRHTLEIDVTSYAELVLAPDAADRAHPAFSNLFVETEFVHEVGAVLATRRRRSPDEPVVWAAHLMVVEGDTVGALQFETDRERFLGRGQSVRTPVAVTSGQPLSNSVGAVLDPIFSLRRRIRLAPGATAHITFWTLVAASRAQVLDLADKHRDSAAFERAGTLAWTLAQVQLFHLGIGPDDANLFQRLASYVIYSNAALRPSSDALTRSQGTAALLWKHGVSGDLPIVVCRIDHGDDLPIVRQLLQAHAYWRMKGLAVDLVILNEHAASYAHDLQTALEALVRASQSQHAAVGAQTKGAVFVLRVNMLPDETHRLLLDVARAVLLSRGGSLFDQVRRVEPHEGARPGPVRPPGPAPAAGPATRRELEFFNGLGGFDRDGRDYVTVMGPGCSTPAPWINVIANPAFGFQVSADGSGYTWAVNSQQHQLTPWSNDPVSDAPGEAFYVRDEEDGALWTPTALPIRQPGASYAATHGQGFSRFEHSSHGISLTLLQFVPQDDPVKISRLTIRNDTGRTRLLAVTAYVEWVLGASRSASAPFIVTDIDPATGAMLARNHWSADFSSRVAFADLGGRQQSWTGDRTEFLGRDGSVAYPAAAASGVPLSKRVGGGLDPCGAVMTRLELPPHGVTDVVFCLGEAATSADALSLVARYRAANLDTVFAATVSAWDDVLSVVQVKTPDRAMDLMLNRWLLYQTLACRVWARAGLYQASGAYGFRDQLQDVLALCVATPPLARAHLLRAAARQFVQGDVQHWWLPPAGQGVRTRVTDDRLWLVYAATEYATTTGDAGVFDEVVPFLDGPTLRADQQESYFLPSTSAEHATLFEHCARALDSSLAVGSHGLPLIGTGDWNDGLNRVGAGGQGESVWLAWFLHATLSALAPVAERRGEPARAASWRLHAAAVAQALEKDGWDGGWYRRAYFDDGTVLGGSANAECRIDSIAQSWGILSGAAPRARATAAMAAVDEQLIRRDDRLALLFTPPFEQPLKDPGYIAGYPPGIRENGGQYTHAATWSVIAFAILGDGDQAVALFDLLNPVNHGATPEDIARYKVEPYVACGDIYAEPQHVGRGGWTWYTGSAGWIYRAGLEWILGFKLRGADLIIDPCIPTAWPGFTIAFRYRSARYEIAVDNPRGVNRGVSGIVLDGAVLPLTTPVVSLADDGATHHVQVTLG